MKELEKFKELESQNVSAYGRVGVSACGNSPAAERIGVWACRHIGVWQEPSTIVLVLVLDCEDDVASKTWIAVREVLSRRDYRTQPGVLTPGNRPKKARPEGAADRCDRRLVRLGLTYLLTSSTAPLGRAVFLSAPGVKTPGSVLKSLQDINSQ